jgi:hypothetical protein
VCVGGRCVVVFGRKDGGSRVRDGRVDTNNQSRGSATRSSMEDDGIWASRERRQQFRMLS